MCLCCIAWCMLHLCAYWFGVDSRSNEGLFACIFMWWNQIACHLSCVLLDQMWCRFLRWIILVFCSISFFFCHAVWNVDVCIMLVSWMLISSVFLHVLICLKTLITLMPMWNDPNRHASHKKVTEILKIKCVSIIIPRKKDRFIASDIVLFFFQNWSKLFQSFILKEIFTCGVSNLLTGY